LAFSGDAWSQQEEWSTGLRIDGVAMPTPAQMTSYDTAFAALFSSSALQTAAQVRYLGVKASPQNVDGKYGAEGLSVERLRPTPLDGGTGGALPQATIAATLTTITPRGAANEGRMYLPATAMKPAGDGRITVAEALAIANAVATFLSAVNNAGAGRATVFSKGTPTAPGGAARQILAVRVGRVIDTQRRRRNQIAELYVANATQVAPGPP
jgi:hypothetical protein